jgi:hypothetical protein
MGLVNGTVGIVGEILVVDGKHVSFRDEVKGLWDSENFDCVAMWSAEARYMTRDRCRAGGSNFEEGKTPSG